MSTLLNNNAYHHWCSLFLGIILFSSNILAQGVIYEAEDAFLSGPVIFEGRGSSGNMYIDFTNPSGDYVEWSVNATNSGSYTLSFAYQLGASSGRPLEMQINGVVVNASTPFPSTGNWDSWETIDYNAALNAGGNTIRLTAIGSSGPNFDYLNLIPNTIISGPPSLSYQINFSDQATTPPSGWEIDYGLPYGTQSNGADYGWLDPTTNNPIDLTSFGRNRDPNPDIDVFRETLMHMDHPGVNSPDGKWEIELPNGTYQVAVQMGDADSEGEDGTRHLVNAEGQTLVNYTPGTGFGVRNGVAQVTVSDGKLTLDGQGGVNSKIHLVVIESTDGWNIPLVKASTPLDGAQNVALNTIVSANFLHLPNVSSNGATSLDNSTITTNTVQLFKITANGDVLVPSTVNGTGGGDAINLTPGGDLDPNSDYRFIINGVKDLAGIDLLPFSAVFSTGQDSGGNTGNGGGDLNSVAFNKEGVVASGHQFTTLTIGPDDKLYALKINGDIYRWTINSNGSLSNEEVLNGWKNSYSSRTAIGLVFDPSSTSNNLIAYVSHCSGGLNNAPEWDGKLSKISGNNLQTEELLLTNLPRSIRDHLTNSLVFGPGEPNVLYFLQGSNSAAGQADGAWGNRPERLLSAACLRLDLSKLPSSLPLNVQTSMSLSVINNASSGSPTMSDGTYNPYHSNAPLTLFASGVRNAYDLVWHSNGQLYIPTNGTSGGSLSPASVAGTRRPDGTFYNGQDIPAIGPNEVQRDWLFRIDPSSGIGYYGHPNPLRGEYVLNRGPVDAADYPSDILPDINYRGAAFDFEFNKSPNGVIEYLSNANGGNLAGAILVCRYSGGSDIIALLPDGPNGDISTFKTGIPGFTGFQDPLDLVENTVNGHIYVSDFGRSEIVLLTPVDGATDIPVLAVTPDDIIIDEDVNDSAPITITISNTGTGLLSNVMLSLSGADADQFSLSTDNAGNFSSGQSSNITLTFSPTSAGPKSAMLTVAPANADVPSQTIPVNGLGKSGEPSLQWIVDTYFGASAVDIGDDNPATNVIHSSSAQQSALLLGAEISAPAFEQVDVTMPVTLEVLSVYGPTSSNPIVAFGWYPTGNPANGQELFNVDNTPASNGQTLNVPVNGSLAFSPTSSVFGFFNRWPFFNNRVLYSEDNLNTFSGAIPHHIRVYEVPGEANAYIIATEEHISGFDFQDIVVVARNIRPFNGNTDVEIAIENLTKVPNSNIGFPADNYYSFSRIENATTHQSHELNTMRIKNMGGNNIVIDQIDISNYAHFDLPNGEDNNLPLTIAPGSFYDLDIQFVESSGSKGLRQETINIHSNAVNAPIISATLHGVFMVNPEGGSEVNVQQIMQVFGFTTSMNGNPNPGSEYPSPDDVAAGVHGDLVLSEFWEQADPSIPIRAIRLAAYKGPGGEVVQLQNAADEIVGDFFFTFGGTWHQSIFSREFDGSDNISGDVATSITEPFRINSGGLTTAGSGAIDPMTGLPSLLGVRMYKAIDVAGNVIPNQYIMIQDYIGNGCGGGSANCDWNDNVIYFMNIQPQGGANLLPQSIAFDPIFDHFTTDAPFPINATASSGLPVSFSVVSGPATVNGNTVSLLGTSGTVTIRASQPGNANYSPAPFVDQSFNVVEPPTSTDLSLSVGASPAEINIYTNTSVQFMLINESNELATNIVVTAPVPNDFAFAAVSTTGGIYEPFGGQWIIDMLEPGGVITMDLEIFALQEDTDVNYFTQIAALDQPDSDSAPNNNNTNIPAEDDEALVVIYANGNAPGGGPDDQSISFDPIANHLTTDAPFTVNATASSGLPVSFNILSGPATINGNTITLDGIAGTVVVQASQDGNNDYNPAPIVNQSFEVLEPGGGATTDLALSMIADVSQLQIYTNVNFTLTLTNESQEAATGMAIAVPVLPNFAFSGATSSTGAYDQYIGQWLLDNLDAGATATLTLSQFALQEDTDVTLFAQVVAASPLDVDSSPNNNASGTPIEDDEASATVLAAGNAPGSQTITFDPIPNKLTSDAPFTVNATASSGLPVSFSIISGPATIDGNIITLDGVAGTVVVQANQAGNIDYDPAPSVNQSFEVSEPGSGGNGGDIDLALSVIADDTEINIYTDLTFTITLTNEGGELANDIVVNAPLLANFAYSSGMPSIGAYNVFTGEWSIDQLAPGEVATLSLAQFALQDDTQVTFFTQVTAANPSDSDSSPNNNNTAIPVEDDEAAVTVYPPGGGPGGGPADQVITFDPIPSQTISDPPFSISAVASSGLPVSFEIVSGPATIDGNVITLDGTTGTVTVQASQDGDTNYNPAPNVDQSFNVIDPNAGGGMDLTLSVSASSNILNIYSVMTFTITIENEGNLLANSIKIKAPIPDGFAFTGASSSEGVYNNYFQEWDITSLAAGESANLTLDLYVLQNSVATEYFTQVMEASPTDVDSSPGNNGNNIPTEDDEALVTVSPPIMASAQAPNLKNKPNIQNQSVPELGLNGVDEYEVKLFPNPADKEIILEWNQEIWLDHLIIFNNNGKVVFKDRILNQLDQRRININSFPSGSYWLQLFHGDERPSILKFIKR